MVPEKVANPRLQPVTLVTPSAKTVHGLTPTPDATSNASPNPKITSPTTKKHTDKNGGLSVKACGALHLRRGTAVTERKRTVVFLDRNNMRVVPVQLGNNKIPRAGVMARWSSRLSRLVWTIYFLARPFLPPEATKDLYKPEGRLVCCP